ncbi:MAG: hypothetical protein H0U95_03930 [Bacteroidetes bacterium]|nr:hypothetical protein [Bacteroidota bacterium]
MQKFKKYIAFFLLLVFSWVLLPAALSHEIFADHEDTDCHFDHKITSASVEATHTHCNIFTTNTPLYDIPELVVFAKIQPILINESVTTIESSYFHLAQLLLPTRAPPTA